MFFDLIFYNLYFQDLEFDLSGIDYKIDKNLHSKHGDKSKQNLSNSKNLKTLLSKEDKNNNLALKQSNELRNKCNMLISQSNESNVSQNKCQSQSKFQSNGINISYFIYFRVKS